MAHALTTERHAALVPSPKRMEFPASQQSIPQTGTMKAISSSVLRMWAVLPVAALKLTHRLKHTYARSK